MNAIRDLVVSIALRDEATRPLRNMRRITDQIRDSFSRFGFQASKANEQVSQSARRVADVYRDANGRLRDSLGRFVAETQRAGKATNELRASVNRAGSSFARLSNDADHAVSSLKNMATHVLGVVSAYQTLGRAVQEAARFEQSKVLIEAMFDNQKAAHDYMQMLQRVAVDSPVLNSQDMFANSKSFISLTKNVKTLEQAWKVVEKLNVMDPAQGVEGAVLAMRELASGDVVSMVERFEMPRSAVKAIKDLPFEQQVKALDQLLSKMNITDEVVQKMGSTTLSQWNRFKEMVSIAFRDAGKSANSELGKALQRVNDLMEKGALNRFVRSVNDVFGQAINSIVNFGVAAKKYIQPAAQFFKENASTIKAVASALGSLFIISKVTGLLKGLFGIVRANPIMLIVTGVVVLLDKLVGMDRVLQIVKNTFKGLYDILMSLIYDTGETDDLLMKLGFSPESASKISSALKSVWDGFVNIKNAIGDFVQNVVVPLIPQAKEMIWSAFQFIKPVLEFAVDLFKAAADAVKLFIQKVVVPQMPVLKDIISTAFNIITPVIKIATRAFQAVSAIVMFFVRNVVIPLIPKIVPTIQSMWKIVGPILKALAGMFEAISGAIEWAIAKFKQFAKFVSNFKMPKIGLPKWMGGNGFIQIPGHATGLSSVPYNDYIARLHKDETVLRADQAKMLEQAGILDRSGFTPRIKSLGGASRPLGNSVVFSPKVDIHVTTSDVKSIGGLEAAVNKKLDEMWNMFLDIYSAEVIR
ncbi:hypothetical protein UM396_14480 [Geobacillus subterraneus]|uniref:phage tail protein n=1 Tax=Geobacillus subterraneus TaxID=129338 RepID=UPI002AC8C880|nr:hypothetical protein [Geobacillus subterraneus]WPZ17788.1 hypothetical protein UM396_14480 [Geobacillus subterraneus]